MDILDPNLSNVIKYVCPFDASLGTDFIFHSTCFTFKSFMIQTLTEKRSKKNIKLFLTTTEFLNLIIFTDTQSSRQDKELLSRKKKLTTPEWPLL